MNTDAADPVASVCVITYNQAPYIEQCLESLASQDAPFDYEVVVRDDCSQDGTPAAIERVRSRYPTRFRVLPSNRNLGMNRNILAVVEAAKAPYIALCEGDDYWLDRRKLAVQVEQLQADPGLTFVSHVCVPDRSGELGVPMFQYRKEPFEFGAQEILEVAGQFAPTASYVFRRELAATLPPWFQDAPVGDFFIEMFATAAGKGLHLPGAMSAYRLDANNSWTQQMQAGGARRQRYVAGEMLKCLEAMESDERFLGLNFAHKKAAIYFNLALAALMQGDGGAFEAAIRRGWDLSARHSPTQHVLYRLRKYPRLARQLLVGKFALDGFRSSIRTPN